MSEGFPSSMISESYEQENNPFLGMIQFVRAVREWKIIPFLCAGFFCLAGIIYIVVTPEVYEARSDILLKGRNTRDVRILTSEPVLSNVVQELAVENIPELEKLSQTSSVAYLRSHLSVKSPSGRPDILNLRFASHDPQAATAILNRLVTVYVSYLNHELYESVEMYNFRARVQRMLSKDISTLIGDTPEQDVQTTQGKDVRFEENHDVQNKLTQHLSESQKEFDDATNRLDKSPTTKPQDRESASRRVVLEDVIRNLGNLKNAQYIKEAIILSRATVPVIPASPLKLTTILPVLVFLGFGLGLGIIYVLNAVDDRFYSPSEFSCRLGLPILEIIQKKTHLGSFLPNGIPSHHSRDEAGIDEFEALRVTLDLIGDKSNVLVISSVDSKAGKTTVSSGLATAFAQSGKRTLLIDGDYLNGTLSRLFEEKDETGLSRVLSDESSFSDAVEENIQCIGDHDLNFLPRGKTIDSSTNLLTTKRFSELLSWCETRYDQIVIDAPVALDSCDASILGEAADGMLLVITPDSTTRRRTHRACCNLKTLGCRLIGVVANQLESNNAWLTRDAYRYQGVEPEFIDQNSGSRAVLVPNPKDGRSFPVVIEKSSVALEQDVIPSINKQRVA
jgi:capsular exopolysaccharide synthesis family protein